MASEEKVTIRFDDDTLEMITKICEKTGESKSVVIRALCLQSMGGVLMKVNATHNTVNKCKYDANFHVRIDKKTKDNLKACAITEGVTLAEYTRQLFNSAIYSVVDGTDRGSLVRKETKTKAVEPSEFLIAFLKKHHDRLKAEVCKDTKFNEDVFQNTCVFFISDSVAKQLSAYGDLTACFKRRYNMHLYRDTKENASKKMLEEDIQYNLKIEDDE